MAHGELAKLRTIGNNVPRSKKVVYSWGKCVL